MCVMVFVKYLSEQQTTASAQQVSNVVVRLDCTRPSTSYPAALKSKPFIREADTPFALRDNSDF